MVREDEEELWTADDVLEYLRSVGRPMTRTTWGANVTRANAPQPVKKTGRTPWWRPEDVRRWHYSTMQGPRRMREERNRRLQTGEDLGWWKVVSIDHAAGVYVVRLVGGVTREMRPEEVLPWATGFEDSRGVRASGRITT